MTHPPLVRRLSGAASQLPAPLVRAATLFVLAIFIGEGVAHAILAFGNWTLEDANAYWAAAERLRDGQPLYAYFDPNSNEVIRYAPWFAYAWVPLTYLPRALVDAAWSLVLIACSIGAITPLLRRPTPAALAIGGLLGPFLLWTASRGNLQPLLVAGLVHGVERRSGPLWIALAASLKAVPILYVLVYAGRGEWGRAAIAVGLTALLTSQMLLFDLSSFAANPGGSQSLMFISPLAWAAAAAVALGLAVFVAFARRRYAWVAASTAAMAVLPRFFLYDLTYLLVGTAPRNSRE